MAKQVEQIDYDALGLHDPAGRGSAHYYHPSHERLPPKYTFGCLGPLCFLAVVLYVLYQVFCSKPYNPAERYQQTVTDSIRYYLKTTQDYLAGGRGVYAKDVMFCVTKDDDWWFNHNYRAIAADKEAAMGTLSEGERKTDPAEMAMHVLLRSGPTDPAAEIKVIDPRSPLATVEVTQNYTAPEPGQTGSSRTYRVELVLEHGLWKVNRFAGARDKFD
ncbi:MAG TPA: hypothetical protein PKH07_10750 [bacterium]|nr:hypothetical protein [bacterium]